MSFVPQETDPLLDNPNRPSSTQNPPRGGDPRVSRTRSAETSSDLDSEDERMGTWGMREKRGKSRLIVDNVGLGCILLGLLMFMPMVQYLVLEAYRKDPKGTGWFVLHPTMQSLAITMAVLSIQSLQTTTSPSGSAEKHAAFRQHQLINLAFSLPILLIGVSSIIYNKHIHNAPHFVSAHGKMGLAIVIWLFVQALVGIVASSAAKKYGDSAKRFYKYHRLSGYLLLPLVLVTAHLGGAYSDWMVKGHSKMWQRVVAFDVGLALVAVGVVVRARPSKMKFL
ncbi:hypothetical protein FFLO_03306 [Filobasidium floriforme]|uniref:Cytochrome b561 domain-containing protein n=1 Tax=Filobasidium floriforme TaxID=5210 RepID=A0A8K0JL34_9TREE|nr:uncharacterized protein HD553DRAFT_143105 [Filobasidium floriforme]KAG7544345.1 hypothetical protein FFLO_03306 [Filobasidium floriforme]KAH8078625.1 hypothetical protein HD553DRAFT_143105 [Filobasidium floriforme]